MLSKEFKSSPTLPNNVEVGHRAQKQMANKGSKDSLREPKIIFLSTCSTASFHPIITMF